MRLVSFGSLASRKSDFETAARPAKYPTRSRSLISALCLALLIVAAVAGQSLADEDDDDELFSDAGFSSISTSKFVTRTSFESAEDYELPPSPVEESSLLEDEDLLPRFRAMERMNRDILNRLDRLEPLDTKVKELSKQVGTLSQKKSEPSGLAGPGGYKPRPPDSVINAQSRQESSIRSSGPRALPNAQEEGNRYLGKIPLSTYLDYGRDGVGFETADGEFTMKFRALAQMDFLNYAGTPSGPTPFDSGFYLPRNRFYFHGNYTKPIGYMLSFQQSYTQFGFLDVFTNVNLDDRFQFRIGRFKVPYGYEWYKMSSWNFVTPERSLFAENFGLNRQVGAMLWGQLFEQRVEYAVGVFDGARNSSQEYNSGKDIATFVNYKPFEHDGTFWQGFGLGGSFSYGVENNPLTPGLLRTNTNATSDVTGSANPVTNATVPFLGFNTGVFERGPRTLYDTHLTYFYHGLSFIGTCSGGTESYQNSSPNNLQVKVPISGYSATVAYLLTGETINERTSIDPISRFDVREGKQGYGAWEPYFRYSNVDVSDKIFTQNISNSTLWTNKVNMTDLGVNWYLNRGIKIYFDWEHAMFGQPNTYGTGAHAMTNDLFWTRFQFYF